MKEMDDLERRYSREDLESLPLGYQTIWERALSPHDAIESITVHNKRWKAREVAQGGDKPITKIVLPPEEA